jgi:hypothetical protein
MIYDFFVTKFVTKEKPGMATGSNPGKQEILILVLENLWARNYN